MRAHMTVGDAAYNNSLPPLEECNRFSVRPERRFSGAGASKKLCAAGCRAEAREPAGMRAAEEELGREYRTWRERVTEGLVETTVVPGFCLQSPSTCVAGGVRSRLIATWPPGTPDAWPATGDAWYEVLLPDGTRLLMRRYGSAALFYAPREKAQEWYLEHWREEVKRLGFERAAAHVRRWLAEYDGCYGSDYYRFVRDEILGPED